MRGRRGGQRLLDFGQRPVKQRTVLGYDQVEDCRFAEYAEQVRNLSSRHENNFAAGILETLQRLHGGSIHTAVMRDGAVVIRRENLVFHRSSLKAILAAPITPALLPNFAAFTFNPRDTSGVKY